MDISTQIYGPTSNNSGQLMVGGSVLKSYSPSGLKTFNNTHFGNFMPGGGATSHNLPSSQSAKKFHMLAGGRMSP